jgi:hypothetical protein
MTPDPHPAMVTPADWDALRQGLTYVWLWAGGAVLAALTMLVGHGVIPSLLDTQSVPPRLAWARPPLYGLAVVAAGFALYMLVQVALIYAAVFLRIYPRFWV